MNHRTDRIAHTTAFVTPVMEHWLEREIAQWDHGGVKNVFDGDVYRGEQFLFLINLASCCSEQMDILESINDIMNVMPQQCSGILSCMMVILPWYES